MKLLASLVNQTNPLDPIIEPGTLFGFSTLVLTMNKAKSQNLLTFVYMEFNRDFPPTHMSWQPEQYLGTPVLTDNVEIIRQDKDVFYRSQ